MVTTEKRTASANKATGTIPVFALDGGNAGIKFAFPGLKQPGYMPAIIKVVDLDMYDLVIDPDDFSSAVVEFNDATYVVGTAAAMMGGSPVYELGKADYTHILLMAALRGVETLSRCPVIERLNVLVPDARRQWLTSVWNPVAEFIKDINEFSVNGETIRPQIRDIRFISEGIPAFKWAMSQGLFSPFLNTPGINQVGVLDIGGGETTFKLFDVNGQINWDQEITLPGLNTLARGIGSRLKSLPGFVITPDTPDILQCLALKHYVYDTPATGAIDFTQHYLDVRAKWAKLMLQKLIPSVSQQGVGAVIIVGGGAHHAESIEKATGGRFFIPQEGVDPTFVNSISMTEM